MTSASSIATGQARLDPLTSLGETLALLARLDAALSGVAAAGGALALLQIDIDGFGAVNAREGDERGDTLLKELAAMLRAAAARQSGNDADPPTAEAFRVGADEFALLLPQTSRLRARRIAAAILAEAAHERLSLSIGIGVAEPGAADLGALLLATDGALRAVRARGGGRARLLTRTPDDMAGATGVVEWLARHTLDVTQQLDRVYQLAMTDPLTELPNQRALTQFLQTEVPRAQRHGRPFAILMVDGDNLKAYNETFGHNAGDEWIKTLGALLVEETRGSDLTVRWRVGDEFVVAMPETTRAAALQAAERIRAAVVRASASLPLPTTVSIGVAAFPDDGTSDAMLLARAEQANALAKRLGKNQIAFIAEPVEEE